MIGAGALGCEYAKAMALMGLGCGPTGSVTVTDNDNIEVSNLNRQFLFRQPDVGSSKAETACSKAKIMNPEFKVTTHQAFVAPETENVFNDDFWESLDFVVNAVDNIKARLYVDRQCVWYEKPLLESGTLGTKANSQMIVPHKTQAYGDSQDPPEESIPMCTLRNFPNQIEHCIEWGRDQFNTMFASRVQDAVEFLRDPEAFVKQLRQNTTSSGVRSQLSDINTLVEIKKTADVNSVVREARNIFNTRYDHSIRDLLHLFPHDHTTSEGTPFWSGPKRCPSPEPFNANDELHLDFVWTCSNLIFANLGLPSIEKAQCQSIAAGLPVVDYVRQVIAVETPEEAKEREAAGRPAPTAPAGNDDDEPVITQLLDNLSVSKQTLTGELTPADFEKDDDSNYHIDFINASANLRARNYKITECDRNKTKMIAGKIIPAIATTTAMITGVVSNEIYKYVQGFTDIAKFKNAFCNLALPQIMFSQPDDIIRNKSKEFDPIMCGPITCIPEGYTNYDKIVVEQGSITFQQLFDWLKDSKGLEISMVTCGNVALYNQYLPGNKHAPRLAEKIEDVYRRISNEPIPEGRRYLRIDVGGTIIESGDDFQIPPIKYYFA
uniref:Ubiquitin-activating enzyme E1 C-terminal domain-containing protein n=1 Tax=Favella ehrenbergii TaxID=182087 RepID=A0A7S3HZG7_9SPIT|mmetsp:Transcript_20980/g.25784  ORF Transcript_20980/g.25784 Transcript_20980/m.25784 type:complete len:607 (+) Transcript_20980:1461-3281(+)